MFNEPMKEKNSELMEKISDMVWRHEISNNRGELLIDSLFSYSAVQGFPKDDAGKAINYIKEIDLGDILDVLDHTDDFDKNVVILAGQCKQSLMIRALVLFFLEKVITPLMAENKTLTLALSNKEFAEL